MSILPPTSDYTSKDFEALKTRLESLLRSVFPTWTDHQVINFGNILEGMFCFVGDVISFNQDANARESRLLSVTQRRNLLALVKLIDYEPSLATAATVDQQFSFTGLTVNVDLLAGQIVKSEGANPIEFQLLSNVTATPGSPTVVVTVENSTTETQVEQGSGEADQAITLSETPFFQMVSVVGASSGEWAEVDNFLSSGPTDQHFIVKVDNSDMATVIFGDGTAGAMPSDVLTLTYKTGAGAIGNVAANSLTVVDGGGLLDVHGDPVTFTTTNPLAASGGTDRETLDEIKANAPASIRNPTTSVSREDFEDHATSPELVGGVTRALMLTHDEDVTIDDNAGRLYAVPAGLTQFPADISIPYTLSVGPSFPSVAKLQEVRSIFVGNTQSRAPRPAPLTFGLQTLAAVYLDTVVNAKVWFTKEAAASTATKRAVKIAIDTALIEFFRPQLATGAKNNQIDFGYYLRQATIAGTQGEIALSDLFDVVRDIPGVRKVGRDAVDFSVTTNTLTSALVSTPIQTADHDDVRVDDTWFPRFKASVITDGDTNTVIT